jgi:hypothetical protein
LETSSTCCLLNWSCGSELGVVSPPWTWKIRGHAFISLLQMLAKKFICNVSGTLIVFIQGSRILFLV